MSANPAVPNAYVAPHVMSMKEFMDKMKDENLDGLLIKCECTSADEMGRKYTATLNDKPICIKFGQQLVTSGITEAKHNKKMSKMIFKQLTKIPESSTVQQSMAMFKVLKILSDQFEKFVTKCEDIVVNNDARGKPMFYNITRGSAANGLYANFDAWDPIGDIRFIQPGTMIELTVHFKGIKVYNGVVSVITSAYINAKHWTFE